MSSCSVRWAFRVGDWRPPSPLLLRLLGCVQREEQERLAGLHYRRDCLGSLAGRLLLRRLLSSNGGRRGSTQDGLTVVPWRDLTLTRTARGKPCLQPPPCPQHQSGGSHWLFNVSHDGGYVILAAEAVCSEPAPSLTPSLSAADGGAMVGVGCDVVDMTRHCDSPSSVTRLFALMRRQFSPHEWRYIDHAPPSAPLGSATGQHQRSSLRRFYRCWALKESYVKALGSGVSTDLQQISFSCGRQPHPSAFSCREHTADWCSHQSRDTASAPAWANEKHHVTTDKYSDWLLESRDQATAALPSAGVCHVTVDGAADWCCRFEESLLDANHIVAVTCRYSRALPAHLRHSAPVGFQLLEESELTDCCETVAQCDATVSSLILSRRYSPRQS